MRHVVCQVAPRESGKETPDGFRSSLRVFLDIFRQLVFFNVSHQHHQ